MNADSNTTDYLGLLAYFLFPLTVIFVGPLEAVLALAAYWLVGTDEEATGRGGRSSGE